MVRPGPADDNPVLCRQRMIADRVGRKAWNGVRMNVILFTARGSFPRFVNQSDRIRKAALFEAQVLPRRVPDDPHV